MAKQLFAILLLSALTFPSVRKAIHAVSEHVEAKCEEGIPSHYHSSEVDCAFDQYVLLPFDRGTPHQLEVLPHIIVSQRSAFKEQLLIVRRIYQDGLRGPPSGPRFA